MERCTRNRLAIERLEDRRVLSTFYVDGVGGDGGVGNNLNTGLSPQQAFLTIQKAADVANPGDTVLVRGGTYHETVTLPRSGSVGAPITFAAFEGEQVTLSAGQLATGPWTSEGGGVYSTSLPLNEVAAIGGRAGLTLFIDGVVGEEAHARDPADLLDASQRYLASNATPTNIDDTGLASFPNGHWDGAFVEAQTSDFTIEYRRIDSFFKINNGTLGRLVVDTPFSRDPRSGDHFLIWDSLNALDSDGEWYYADGDQSGDDAQPRLYLRTPGGADPSGFEIDVKRRDNVIEMAGRDHIHIKDFTFRGGDIDLTGSSDTLIQNVTFYATDRNLGPEGNSVRGLIYTGDNNVVRDSRFDHIYSLMIRLNGEGNQVINNRFQRGFGANGPSAISLNGREHLISHNTFAELGRSAIGGIAAPETQIQYNDFSEVAQLTFDVGAIYLINSSQGNTEIRYNTFHDIDSKLSNGLYLDNQTTDVVAHHNVFYSTSAFGGKINLPTSFALFFNNTFYNSGRIDAFSATADRNAYGSKFFNNIYSTFDADLLNGGDPVELDGNFSTSSGANFTNPAVGDFSLQPGSGAIDAGVVLPGVNDGFIGSAPDAGALEFGEPMFETGHNFASPPTPVYDYERIIFTNLIENPSFEQGFEGWDTLGAPSIHNANVFNYKDSALGRFGTRSVRLSAGERVSRTFTGLEPNTTYVAGAWAKIATVIEGEDPAVITNVPLSKRSGYRGEGDESVGQLTDGEYFGFQDVDFDRFDRLQLMMALTGSGDTVEVRRGSPSGTLITTVAVTPNLVVWDPPVEASLTGQTGVDDLYVVFRGTGDIGLLDEVRLIDSTLTDGVILQASSFGGAVVNRSINDIDFPAATPTITFTTGPSSTSATISLLMPTGATTDGFVDYVTLTESASQPEQLLSVYQIDFGPTGNGVTTGAIGPADLPGDYSVWNGYNDTTNELNGLTDALGSPAPEVKVRVREAGDGQDFVFAAAASGLEDRHANYSGFYAPDLLSDLFFSRNDDDLGVRVEGLEPGDYDVYAIAREPNSGAGPDAASRTYRFDIGAGSASAVKVGDFGLGHVTGNPSIAPNTWVENQNYYTERVSVGLGESLYVLMDSINNDFGLLQGLQLVQRSRLFEPPELIGDYNRDGAVNAADYTIWRDSNGDSVPPYTAGDGDGDGSVDPSDYDVWSANYAAGPFSTTLIDAGMANGSFEGWGPNDASTLFIVSGGVITIPGWTATTTNNAGWIDLANGVATAGAASDGDRYAISAGGATLELLSDPLADHSTSANDRFLLTLDVGSKDGNANLYEVYLVFDGQERLIDSFTDGTNVTLQGMNTRQFTYTATAADSGTLPAVKIVATTSNSFSQAFVDNVRLTVEGVSQASPTLAGSASALLASIEEIVQTSVPTETHATEEERHELREPHPTAYLANSLPTLRTETLPKFARSLQRMARDQAFAKWLLLIESDSPELGSSRAAEDELSDATDSDAQPTHLHKKSGHNDFTITFDLTQALAHSK